MKRLLMSLMLLIFSQTLLLAQITSTTTGGNWSETTTWIGSVVPTATDDVVIDGTVAVNIYDIKCNNLTINNNDTLTKDNNGRNFFVIGDLTNNGIITEDNYGSLTISVSGNVINNGVWDRGNIVFTGTNDNKIIMGAEKTINESWISKIDMNSYLIIASNGQFNDCRFTNDPAYFGVIPNSTYKLKIEEGSNYIFDLMSTSQLYSVKFNGSGSVLKNAILSSGSYGPLYLEDTKLKGKVVVSSDSVFFTNSNVIIEDTLTKDNNGRILLVIGDLTNNGTITEANYADFHINISGDFINNGKWEFAWVVMDAAANQIIESADSIAGSIRLNSNVVSSSTYQWYKNGVSISGETSDRLDMFVVTSNDYGEYYCQTNAGNSRMITIRESNPVPTDAIVSTLTGGNWFETSTWVGGVVPTATDNVVIDGTVEADGGRECKNLIVNSGKILTSYTNTATVKVSENIINNGTIQDNDWMSFFIEVKGNITNNGVWSNYETRMNATTDQTISGTSPYSGQGFLMSRDPFVSNGQKLIAGSDLSFDGVQIYCGNSEFIIDSEKTVSFFNTADDGSGITRKMHFSGGGTVNADSTFMFGDSTSFNNVTLTGVIDVSGIIIKENVELLGTLTRRNGSGWVNIEEDFTNDGIISDGSFGQIFGITAFKNITNNGFWENYEITMDGTTDQTFINNEFLHCQFNFNANVTSATTFQWYKDGVAIDDVYATGEIYYYTKQASFEEYNPYGEYYCQTNSGNSRTITIISGGSGGEGVILTENFDSETFPTNGWTQTILNTSKTWLNSNPLDKNFTSIDPTSVYSALCSWIAADQDEWLNSPVVALPDDEIQLAFYAGFSTEYLTSATMKLNVSVDGGSTWTKIWEANNDGNGWQWREISLDLSDYKNNANVMLGWQYVGNDGDLVGIDNVELSYGTVGVEKYNSEIPTEFALNQNYPNPFNPSTIISYALPKQGLVTINIYNILGQKVSTLVNETQNAGNYQFNFDASNLSTGTYIYQIRTGSFVQSKKMLLIK